MTVVKSNIQFYLLIILGDLVNLEKIKLALLGLGYLLVAELTDFAKKLRKLKFHLCSV